MYYILNTDCSLVPRPPSLFV